MVCSLSNTERELVERSCENDFGQRHGKNQMSKDTVTAAAQGLDIVSELK